MNVRKILSTVWVLLVAGVRESVMLVEGGAKNVLK
jgi:hypothetical protein